MALGVRVNTFWTYIIFSVATIVTQKSHEPSPQDGWFNNLVHPDWGAIDGQLIRKSPSAYADGVYHMSGQDRPNPFEISSIAHHGEPGLPSYRGRTAMLVFFGQQVVEEILDSQRPGCPREFENIQIPKNHRYNPEGKEDLAMPFLRTRYDSRTGYSPNNPRQQLNEITPYLDGTLVYGPGKAWTDAIREFKGGRLKTKDPNAAIEDSFPVLNDIRLPFANPPNPRDHVLKPVSRFFRIGNPRGNENPMLLSFAILFFRLHNRIAANLESQKYGNDEQIFEEARRQVIAHHQKIVVYDWLPAFLEAKENGDLLKIPPYYRSVNDNTTDCGEFCAYNGYNSEVNPAITQEFQTAAMRFGHTLVTPGLWLRGKKDRSASNPQKTCNFTSVNLNIQGEPGKVHALRLCNAYWNAQETIPFRLDEIVRGMTSTIAEREDHIMVPDLREHVFGPLDFSRRDLAALNIQRGRDHGLPGYNDVREAYGLERYSSWHQISLFIPKILDELRALYHNDSAPDNLDLFTGGLLETIPDGPGPLFKKIMLEQFIRIRHSDRFWYENKERNGPGFSDDFIQYVQSTTLKDIILNVTSIVDDELPSNVFFNGKSDICKGTQLKADSYQEFDSIQTLENCTSLKHYDYFSGSEVSFTLSFVCLGLCVPGTIAIMMCMAKRRQTQVAQARRKIAKSGNRDLDPNTCRAVEWVGPKMGERHVLITFDVQRKKLHVTDTRKKPLRMIDLRRVAKNKNKIHMRFANDGEKDMMSIRVPNEIDLVLRFPNEEKCDEYRSKIETFLKDLQIAREAHFFSEKSILSGADTKEDRQAILDKFLRVVCLQANTATMGDIGTITADEMSKVRGLQLNRTEFADALGLKPNSTFVRNMFLTVDVDNSGTVGFEEFSDMFKILSTGDAESKSRLFFEMFDLKKRGYLTREDFEKMIMSFMDLSDEAIVKEDLDELVQLMYTTAGISVHAKLDFENFKKVFDSPENTKILEGASLTLEGMGIKQTHSKGKNNKAERRKTFLQSYKDRSAIPRGNTSQAGNVKVKTKSRDYPTTVFRQKLFAVLGYIENYRLQIFWVTLYCLVTAGIFIERAYYYSFEREHGGLRRIAGYGVTVTRGAASAMMFTYSSLLLTMSRNTITFLRETFFNRFIPFDSAHSFHKLIAAIALFFTVVHCIGHGINLYHISTQASTDLNCVFREYFRATDVLASFHYWAYNTITGLTGIILTVIVIVMYVFAIPYARRNLFNAFWATHKLYILLYLFMVLHGSGRLVQNPLFQNFFYGPLVVFVIDKLLSLSRKKRIIDVKQADLLPSDVTALKFDRPLDFEYRSGQWVRIACLDIAESEYHPFTLTSAPHEDFLSVHVRAVGPWTINLRSTYDPNNIEGKVAPKLYLDGPFGEGHQDWYKYPVAVLVGGGIGVTPFASILKDIVYKSQFPATRMACRKVYFLWVTRTQKQFEWLTDIIKQVEKADNKKFVSTHIFITQFRQKFDLRTTMLYICERQFQKVAGKSLFTGLRAKTHFGRPEFQDFLSALKHYHPNVQNIGVFSCGPPPMTIKVDKACGTLNKWENYPTYHHHFENF